MLSALAYAAGLVTRQVSAESPDAGTRDPDFAERVVDRRRDTTYNYADQNRRGSRKESMLLTGAGQ